MVLPPALATNSLAQSFVDEIAAYLQQGDSEALSSDAAAQRLLAIFYRKVEGLASRGETAPSVEDPLRLLWTTFLATAAHIHQDDPSLPRLARLLLALKSQPAPTSSLTMVTPSAAALLHGFEQEWGQTFWVNLPVFGMTIHDTESRNPEVADGLMIEVGGRMIPANLGEEPYSPDEWASLRNWGRCA